MKRPSVQFTDAQDMQCAHPRTFQAPTPDQLAELRPGWYAKICALHERFWVEIETIDEWRITGTVANDLVFTDDHGLRCGDWVEFEMRHVYQTLSPDE